MFAPTLRVDRIDRRRKLSEVCESARERGCPACASGVGVRRGEKDGFRFDSCRDCGTLYARRAADDCDYDTYYHDANLSVPAFIDRRLDEIVATFAPHRRANRLLDIGCGAGSLLQAARRAGWDATGTEVSRTAAAHVRAAGFEVFHGELAAARYPDAHFDVVTASEILEHLPDPLSLVAEIARVLRPNGLFWATTPHARGVSSRLLGLRWSTVSPPEHLQLFSLGGARRLLARAGFTRTRLTTRGCNALELWHALRRAPTQGDAARTNETKTVAVVADNATGASAEKFDRVATAYKLNEALLRNGATRAVKSAINLSLAVSRLGDSIRISAER
jgi:SAM-dependent methyltransferase